MWTPRVTTSTPQLHPLGRRDETHGDWKYVGDDGFNGGGFAAGLEWTIISPSWNNQSVNPDSSPPSP
jgi:hypothetical protein